MMEHPSNPWAASLQPLTGSPPIDSSRKLEPGVALHILHLMHPPTLSHDDSPLESASNGQLKLLLHHLAFKIYFPCLRTRLYAPAFDWKQANMWCVSKLGSQDSQIVRNQTRAGSQLCVRAPFPGADGCRLSKHGLAPALPDCRPHSEDRFTTPVTTH